MEDSFDDGVDDKIFLEAVESFDNNILLFENNNFGQTPLEKYPQRNVMKQNNIYDCFGLVRPSVSKIVSYEDSSGKHASRKPILSSNTPKIAYEPNVIHQLDSEAYKVWIYPINYPIRDYQFNIVQKALFTNTLVSLPTGIILILSNLQALGKRSLQL